MTYQDDSRCWEATHHSYSKDGDFDACQYRWHAFDAGLKSNVIGEPGCVGLAVDAAAMDLIAGRDPDVAKSLEHAFKEQRKFARKNGEPAPKFTEAAAHEKALALYQLFEREVFPTYTDVYATQYIVHWETPDGVKWHCHIDVIFNDGSIIDLKTSTKRLTIDRAELDYQLTTYATAIWRAFGHLPPSVGIDQLTFTKPPPEVLKANPNATKPWWDRSRSERTRSQLEVWEADAVRRQSAMAYADATGCYQTQGRASLYECKGCPVQPICPTWAGYPQVR